MSEVSTLAPDAAVALGLASTAMPFARTPAAQAERWLRILRLHGDAGAALQALGVGEGPLRAHAQDAPKSSEATRGDDRDMVGQVTAHARRLAGERKAACVATTDVLLAVIRVYGEHFDRVLDAYGTDRDEVMSRLGVDPPTRSGDTVARNTA
ncbi:MAG: hypothetical protein ACTHM1_05325 [Solirubrobacteraceae bacterium]